LPLIREKIHVVNEIPTLFETTGTGESSGELSFVSAPLPYSKNALVWKKEKDIANVATHINAVVKIFESMSDSEIDFTADKIKTAIWPYTESIPAEDGGRGSVLWPMRFALSGKEKSPDPFIMSAIIGKQETLVRLGAALKLIKTT